MLNLLLMDTLIIIPASSSRGSRLSSVASQLFASSFLLSISPNSIDLTCIAVSRHILRWVVLFPVYASQYISSFLFVSAYIYVYIYIWWPSSSFASLCSACLYSCLLVCFNVQLGRLALRKKVVLFDVVRLSADLIDMRYDTGLC